jgi:hypothetical protein
LNKVMSPSIQLSVPQIYWPVPCVTFDSVRRSPQMKNTPMLKLTLAPKLQRRSTVGEDGEGGLELEP